MAMFGFASDDRTVDQVRFEEEGMMNFVARDDRIHRCTTAEWTQGAYYAPYVPEIQCAHTEANEPSADAEPAGQNPAEKST